MSILEAIVQAAVQGLTEFLPVSSSGHLILTRWLFGWQDPGLEFDVAVHLGTLAAILWAFRRQVVAVLAGVRDGSETVDGLMPRRLIWLGVLGTIPIAVVGGLLYETVEDELRSVSAAAALLIVTGLMLGAADWRVRHAERPLTLSELTGVRAVAIGLAQCLAILPGVSRSGVCIIAMNGLGYSRESAVRWAFWLSMPALAGAGTLSLASVVGESREVDATALIVGALVSFVTALVAIRALLWLVRGRSLAPFAVYCVIAGVAVLIARAAGL